MTKEEKLLKVIEDIMKIPNIADYLPRVGEMGKPNITNKQWDELPDSLKLRFVNEANCNNSDFHLPTIEQMTNFLWKCCKERLGEKDKCWACGGLGILLIGTREVVCHICWGRNKN